jgi:hypothetical protein
MPLETSLHVSPHFLEGLPDFWFQLTNNWMKSWNWKKKSLQHYLLFLPSHMITTRTLFGKRVEVISRITS